MNSDPALAGILCRVLATFFFAGVMVLAQVAITSSGFAMTYFLRGVSALPIIMIFMVIRGSFPSAIATARPADHFLRGLLAAASLACTFAAISRLPVSLAAALSFLAPVFVTVGAGLFLRESVAWRTWVAVGLSCIGVWIACRSDAASFGGSDTMVIGVLYGMSGALLMAFSMLQLKRLSATESAATLAFYFSVAITVIGAGALILDGNATLQIVTGAAVLAGVSGALGQLFLAESMRLAPASRLAPFDYLLLVWTSLWDVVVSPGLWSIDLAMAALLIGFAALITLLPSRSKLPIAR